MISYENAKILVVDDEPANIFFLEGILSEEKFKVVTANDGFECLEKLKKFTPDIILLDIMMPKLNGLDVLIKIVDNEKLKHIPVIMVSAKVESEDVEVALSMGALEYIKKPIDEVELIARVKSALRIKFQDDKLREMIKSKDDFIRMVSHDVRNPFHAILGFADILINDPEIKEKLNEENKAFLNYIFDSANFVVDYFNKLLSWASLGQNELKLKKENAQLFKLINSSIMIYQKKISEKNIKLLIDCNNNIYINIDETYFLQAINNIISNAIKFTPEGGKININATINNNETKLIISDSGIGMDKVSPEEFFSRTYNISRKGTKGEKGTGTGMNICKKIIDAHNFRITFESEIKKGTSFIITIPN